MQKNLFDNIKKSLKPPTILVGSAQINSETQKGLPRTFFDKKSASANEKKLLKDKYNECLENANSLLTDARMLHDRYSYPRSCFLAITSYEETAKSQLIKHYFNGKLDQNTYEKCFKKHPKKFGVVNLRLKQNKKGEQIVIFDDKLGERLLKFRNNTLYVDEQNSPNLGTTIDQSQFFIKVATEWLYLNYDKKMNWDNGLSE